MNRLYFASTDLYSSFGVFHDTAQTFVKPEKRIERVTVPGKNGDLIYWDGAYENVIISYPCFIRSNFAQNFTNLVNFLNSYGASYQTLYTSDRTDEYRHAVFHSAVEPETGQWNRSGMFVLNFDCKPQVWLQSGTVNLTFTSSGVLSNPTMMIARPIINAYGNGSFTVNGTTVTVANSADHITIDCEIMDCYRGTVQMNEKVTFSGNDFPTLKPGNNVITLGTGITRIDIAPKWWHL